MLFSSSSFSEVALADIKLERREFYFEISPTLNETWTSLVAPVIGTTLTTLDSASSFSEVAFSQLSMAGLSLRSKRETWSDRFIDTTTSETWSNVSPSGSETWSTISPSSNETWVDKNLTIIQDNNMASTYTANSGVEKIGAGEQAGAWGTTTNNNLDILDRAINGVGAITLSGTTHTLTTSDGTLSDGGFKVLVLGGSPSGTNTITISPNDQDKMYFVQNGTNQTVTFTQGSGANVSIVAGSKGMIYADGAGSGAAVVDLTASIDVSALRLAGTAITSTAAELNKLDGVNSTTAELNIVDGDTSVGTTAVAAGDGIVTNDAGTMRHTTAATFSTYFNANLVEVPTALNMSGTVTLTPSGAQSVYQRLTVASGSQTLRIAITNLLAGQHVIIDKTTSANSLTIDWTNSSAVTSSGITLGSSVEFAIGIFNGAGFSFTETVKFQVLHEYTINIGSRVY